MPSPLRFVLLLVVSSTVQVLGADPQRVAQPHVQDDQLRIELFAAEPDIVTPVSLTFDAAGRVLVVENHTHQRPDGYAGPPADRIRILEDRDGDGRAETVGTFFEGTSLTTNLAAHPNGWIYVSTRREIFRIRDDDGDGRSDRREQIVAMETAADYPHNGLSGFAFDLAGNVYFTLGENYGEDYRLTAADGKIFDGGQGAGCIFRCRADGSELARVATGFWNTFHLAFDAFGHLFAVDNDPGNRPPCRLLQIVDQGDYGYRRRELEPFISWNGELPGMLPMLASTGEAPTGILVYESDNLPEPYRGNLLIGCWGENRVDRYTIEPDGATFKTSATPLIVGGQDFRPSGIALAPDGSVYISDWADRAYPVHGKGRIWRLSTKNASTPRRPDELRAQLSAKHRPLREAAARKFAAEGDAGKAVLLDALRHDIDERARAVALAALAELGLPSHEVVEAALADSCPQIREQAVRTLPPALLNLSELAKAGEVAGVRAAALRRLYSRRDSQVALNALRQNNLDVYTRQAARLGLRGVFEAYGWQGLPIELLLKEELPVMLVFREWQPSLFRATADGLLLDKNPANRFIATQYLGDYGLREHREILAYELHKRKTDRMLFEATLAAIAKLDGVMDKWNKGLVGDWWHKQSKTYEIAADVLADARAPSSSRKWSLRILPANHPSLDAKRLDELLASPDETLRAEAVLAVRNSKRLNDAQRANRLLKIVQDDAQPAAIRAEATIGLDAANTEQRAVLVQLAQDSSSTVRDEALRSLRGAALDDSQRDAISQFAVTDQATGDLVASVLNPPPPAPTATLSLDAWLALLEGPADAEAGQRIFFHPKGPGCFHCHMIEGRGRAIGPEFTRTAGRLGIDRRRLVESILFPSKEIAPAYVPWNIITTDGRALTGIFHRDTGKVRSFWDARGELFEVKVSDIEEMLPQRGSIMPENLAAAMTMQEFRDLLAFLIRGDANEN